MKLLGLDRRYMFYVEQGAHSTQLCRIKKVSPNVSLSTLNYLVSLHFQIHSYPLEMKIFMEVQT